MSTRRTFLTYSVAAGIAGLAFNRVARAADAAAPTQAATPRRARGVVNTVQGPLDAAKLGFTLTHEHMYAGSAGFMQAWPEFFGGRANFIANAVDNLKRAKAEGVDTVVDVTPMDVGRDIRLIEEISRKSGMQIVASTGHWLYPSLSMDARTVEELTDFFVKEIERGIEDTDIKAGAIKVATDRDGVTPFLQKALRAAARASKATGVPIETHTYAPGRVGEKQAEIFEAEGLSPARVCIGHSDDTDNLDYLLGLARRGYTIGMDRMTSGIKGAVSWQKRAESVKALIDAGLAGNVFISNDWFFGLSIAGTEAAQAVQKSNPDGMLFAVRKTIPYLKQMGVSAQAIRTITVENPKRFFGGV